MGHEMDLQLGKVGLSGSARRHCFPSPAINPVAELQLAASTNRRSHRHHIPESLPESQKLPTRFAEDPRNGSFTRLRAEEADRWEGPGREREASVMKHSTVLLSFAVICNVSHTFAQSPQFNGISQSITKAVQAEWRRFSDTEITCIGPPLPQRGSTILAPTDQGIPPSDAQIAAERVSCGNQIAQPISLTRTSSPQTDPYSVDGLALGAKVAFESAAYRQYHCVPSQQFQGFVWCTKASNDKQARGRVEVWSSILHAQDGTVAYVNRYRPAYWTANEVADEIQRLSRKIGEEPHIIQLSARPGLPRGTLATWGKVVLEPIVDDEVRLLAEDKALEKGIAIDFIGNFTQSARRGLPIYRLAGGAGFVWVASYNQNGRGTLRSSAVDASTYSPQELPPPPPAAAQMPGGAATAVDAEPTGATTQ
jgi:hypothetical protein